MLTKNKNFFNSPEHLIRCIEFNLEYDGGFHFSIDQKLWVNNLFLGLAIFGIFFERFVSIIWIAGMNNDISRAESS